MLELRNIGIIAHVDAGKALLERAHPRARSTKATRRWIGPTKRGRHGITITAAATQLKWRQHTVNRRARHRVDAAVALRRGEV